MSGYEDPSHRALVAVCADMAAELAQARTLLAECRPIVARAEWVFTPPKGTCIWGVTAQVALLARLDAALGEP